jgi:hypothetical protein
LKQLTDEKNELEKALRDLIVGEDARKARAQQIEKKLCEERFVID